MLATKTIGERIQEEREKRFWNRSALAIQLNVTRDAVFKMEKGMRKPSKKMAQKLADLFDLYASDFE